MSTLEPVRLTLLNAMAGTDFSQALDRHVEWRFKLLDLKDQIFGRNIADLDPAEARRARELIDARGLKVYCLSTGLFYDEVELGETHFQTHLKKLLQVLESASILRPTVVRLLSAKTRLRGQLSDAVDYIYRQHHWLIDFYREAIDRISDAGFIPMIENEVHGAFLSTPHEIIQFFRLLDRPQARLIWDISNLWQMGTFPTLEVYESLRPLIGSVHLKGQQFEPPGRQLHWASSLEDSSWPVIALVSRIVADRVSPVLCLNPSHGQRKPGYDYEAMVSRDISFLRRAVKGIE